MSDPVFHLNPMGRLANLMIEYMVALKFADIVGGCRISNISIPQWGIHHPAVDSEGSPDKQRREHHIDLPALAKKVHSGETSRIEWTGFGQRLENFLPRERYQDVFVSPFKKPMGYGEDYLVCPVRAEDILNGPNCDYVLTPIEFYRDVAALTGLKPVFIGQTQSNPYMDRIRAAFPQAIFREPQDDLLVDFETIRQSKNLVVGVSTYSWLAAWLSLTADNIYLPISGLYNPMQKQEVDLLPFGEARYKFFLFPINFAVRLHRHAEIHRRIAPYWRMMPHAALRQQFSLAPRFKRDRDEALAVFDATFYLDENTDVAAAAQTHGSDFARGHYINHGFQENRWPLPLDRAWYASEYPLAAFEVSQGDYIDFAHHYVAIGKSRGYRPCPPKAGD